MSQAFLYDSQGQDREVELTPKTLAAITKKQLLWVDLTRSEQDELRAAGKILSLQPEALALIETPPEPAQLDKFKDHVQFGLPLPPPHSRRASNRLDFLIGQKWLLTVRDGEVAFLERFRDQDKAETLTGNLTPAALAASLLDWHLEDYNKALAEIEASIDKIDEDVLQSKEKRPPLSTLAAMRRRVSRLREALSEHRPIIHGLLRPDVHSIAEAPAAAHYQRLETHFDRVEDGLKQVTESVVSSFDLYATRTAQDTNRLIRALTLVTVITGFIGAIAGVFGMNFDAPFSHSGMMGFEIVTGSMVGLSLLLILVAFWRKWL